MKTTLVALAALTIAFSTPSRAQTVTASSVEALGGSLEGIKPAVTTPLGVEGQLSPLGSLGSNGPIGAYGPLGTLGPIGGSSSYSVSDLFKDIGGWSSFSKSLTLKGGPLSKEGPLGPKGPLGDAYNNLDSINGFSQQLEAGGVWTVLGPLGPLGALGPLGPLGPMGAHGFARTDDGDYVNNAGKVQHSVVVDGKTFDLVELYTEQKAKSQTNDTSFLVYGEIESKRDGYETDDYTIVSGADQFLTLLVVPEKSLDVFSLKVVDADTKKMIATSNSKTLINWAQLKVVKGQTLRVRVSLEFSGHFLSKTYRLIATGSTNAFTKSSITGPHQH